MTYRMLLLSDAHPDATTAGFSRFDDVALAMMQAVDVAIAEKVDRFCFLGDLCDHDRGRAQASEAQSIRHALRLWKAGIPQTWLVGNHDVIEDGRGESTLTPLAMMLASLGMDRSGEIPLSCVIDAPRIFAEPKHGVVFVCLPYVERASMYDPSEYVRKVATHLGELHTFRDARKIVVLGHLTPPGIVPGSEAYELARGGDMLFPTDAVLEAWGDRALMFCGHIHKRQVHRGVQVVGSLVNLSFAEEENTPGFLVVEIGG